MIDKLVNLYDDFTKRNRIEDLEQLGREYGFEYEKRASYGHRPTELKTFNAFSGKGNKRLLGVLTAATDAFKGTSKFYDYLNTKDLETKTQSIVEIYCDDFFADPIIIQPKSGLSKLKGWLVSEARQFPELKEFYQLFKVSTEHQEDSLWLSEKALSLLIDFPGLTLEAQGNHFIFYYRKKELELTKIMPLVEMAEEFVRLTCHDRSADYV